jgi:integrase
LELCILTATRTSEVLNAKWGEFDLKKAIWTIPAVRMKAGLEHRIPLTARAVAILKSLHKFPHDDHVFPGNGSVGRVLRAAQERKGFDAQA